MSNAVMVRAAEPLVLHEDRYFDSDPAIRRTARTLYEETRDLPLVCPHGHVDPRLLADNRPFPEPTSLLITSDHYVLRMLYSQGIPPGGARLPPARPGAGKRRGHRDRSAGRDRPMIDLADARRMARALAYDLARKTYQLDRINRAGGHG